jgi:hypothetical protein
VGHINTPECILVLISNTEKQNLLINGTQVSMYNDYLVTQKYSESWGLRSEMSRGEDNRERDRTSFATILQLAQLRLDICSQVEFPVAEKFV